VDGQKPGRSSPAAPRLDAIPEVADRILKHELRLDDETVANAWSEAIEKLEQVPSYVGQRLSGAMLEPSDGVSAIGLSEHIDPLHETIHGRSPIDRHSCGSLPEAEASRLSPAGSPACGG
jgi:hypothetical protein